MKKNNVLLYLCILTQLSTFCQTETPQQTNQPPIVVPPITISPVIHVNTHALATQETTQAQQTHATQQIITHQLPSPKIVKEQMISLGEQCTQLIQEHKLVFLGGGVLSAYTYVWLRLLYLGYRISSQNSWSNWKDETSLYELLSYPQQELAHEQLYAIQERYQKSDNLTDFFSPLLIFIQAIDQEEKEIDQFIKLHQKIDTLHLSRLFPQQKLAREIAPAKLERIAFLKGLFLNWITEYKIANNTPINLSRK